MFSPNLAVLLLLFLKHVKSKQVRLTISFSLTEKETKRMGASPTYKH